MVLHKTTGRWKLGLGLVSLTVLLWGILPIALKNVLEVLDPFTVTGFRFTVAVLCTGIFVWHKGQLPRKEQFDKPILKLLLVAFLGLCGNYLFFLLGLRFLSPSTAQVVIQLAPLFLLVGSLIIFKESFSLLQGGGVILFLFGLLLFFNERLMELFSCLDDYTAGVLLVFCGAWCWAAYALAQKQLLKNFPSQTIMLMIYLGAMLAFLPFSDFSALLNLDLFHFAMLMFCALNTVFAYGFFAEALNHWDASRVSAINTTVPLVTVAAMKLCNWWFPDFLPSEDLGWLSIIGAVLVVAGSMTAALGRKKSV